MYQHKKAIFGLIFKHSKERLFLEISIFAGVGSGVVDSLLFNSKRSGGVDFTPFFPKELELDFTPK